MLAMVQNPAIWYRKSIGYDVRADIDAAAIDRNWTNALPTAGKDYPTPTNTSRCTLFTLSPLHNYRTQVLFFFRVFLHLAQLKARKNLLVWDQQLGSCAYVQ